MKAPAALRLPILLFVGALLIQSAWILAIRPFRGADEHDHVFRAAAVAHGQWVADPSDATRGTGALVLVPRDIVDAAQRICQNLPGVTSLDCSGVDQPNGMVLVASGAGRYNPLYYWLVGTPARAFHGATAVYVMRLVSAILSSALIGLGGWTISLWAKSRWPLASLLVALTPVAIYSTAVVAPNGLEICAAAVVWCAFLGLSRPRVSRHLQRRLIWAALPGAVALVTVRSLGPFWLGLIFLGVLPVFGIEGLSSLVRRCARALAVAAVIVSAAAVASLWWILSMGSLEISSGDAAESDPLATTLRTAPVWLYQSIAAFPLRNELAPALVYVCALLVGLPLLAVAFRVGPRRIRTSLLLVLVFSTVVPVSIAVATFDSFGNSWQGRYGLPVSIGLALLAGLALESVGVRSPLAVLAAGSALLAVAHIVSVTNVLSIERRYNSTAGSASWHPPEPWMLVLLVGSGWLCWVAALHLQPLERHQDPGARPRRPGAAEPVAVNQLKQPTASD